MVVRCLLIEISIFLFRSRLEIKMLVRVNTLIEGFAATKRWAPPLSTQYQPLSMWYRSISERSDFIVKNPLRISDQAALADFKDSTPKVEYWIPALLQTTASEADRLR
jgi:hypothetical protein